MAHKLILLRHGQSLWNKENRFTGWVDIDLSEQGLLEAKKAADLLKNETSLEIDLVYTSVLKRAIRTLWTVLDDLDLMWLPITRAWQLNERHYGALQGLNKIETVNEYGKEQVFTWRRSYDTPPPPLSKDDASHPCHDRRYSSVKESQLPDSEALKQTLERVVPYWQKEIVPQIKNNKTVFIVAHGNSLRALVKHLDNISDEEIAQVNIPTGLPLIYELDDNLIPIKNYYLGDAEEAKKAAEAVANQTSDH